MSSKGWSVVRVMLVNKASSAAQRSVRGCSRRKKKTKRLPKEKGRRRKDRHRKI